MDKTKLAIDVFDNCAKEYQDKFMNQDLYNDTFDLFCNLIERKNAEILEIGCGPGNITKYLLSQRPDFNILGTDLSQKMIKLAETNIPTAQFKVLDCREITKIKKNFDALMCGFILPYITKEDIVAFIQDCYLKLNLNGILYLSTMEGNYNNSGLKTSSSGKGGMYIHYYERKYLTKILSENGFKILNINEKIYPELSEETKNDIIIIAKK